MLHTGKRAERVLGQNSDRPELVTLEQIVLSDQSGSTRNFPEFPAQEPEKRKLLSRDTEVDSVLEIRVLGQNPGILERALDLCRDHHVMIAQHVRQSDE